MTTNAPSYRWLFWAMALMGLALDQAAKYGVFYHLYRDGRGGDDIYLIPGAFRLIAEFTPERDPGDSPLSVLRTWGGEFLPRVNHGALFGLGGKAGDGRDANALFAVVSVAAALAIIYWSTRRQTGQDRFLCLALGLILAGTLGNLYDRLVFGGVRDFLLWDYLINWPVFNLADCCLVVGAGLLLLQAFFTEPHPAAEATAAPAEVKNQEHSLAEVK
jgi:lipoprotein signal peptidase